MTTKTLPIVIAIRVPGYVETPPEVVVIDDNDFLACPCGNTPSDAGFSCVLPDGTRVEPDHPDWKGLYACDSVSHEGDETETLIDITPATSEPPTEAERFDLDDDRHREEAVALLKTCIAHGTRLQMGMVERGRAFPTWLGVPKSVEAFEHPHLYRWMLTVVRAGDDVPATWGRGIEIEPIND